MFYFIIITVFKVKIIPGCLSTALLDLQFEQQYSDDVIISAITSSHCMGPPK